MISGSTPSGKVIEQGAHLKIYIPMQFKIDNMQRAASSCATLSGFTDDILCEFDLDDSNGYSLSVYNGFDSV